MDEELNPNEPKIVETDVGAKDGQTKCPKCGSTDISVNTKTGKLRCNFCRHEFEPEKIAGMEENLSQLKGEIVASGTKDITEDASKGIITLKCTSCGAEVVVDTAEATSARCHWCRNVLSINQQVPNGSVPDVVLPFKLSKKEAQEKIEEFVNKRKFYANPKFKKDFTTENIMGVYFPYMIVDVNGHATFSGQGEKEIRSYTEKHGDNTRTYYDYELYSLDRNFDITISGLTLESNVERLDRSSRNKTNNIINSIMPFDTENCAKWDANYLQGFTSEKRDTNVDELKPIIEEQSKDIARNAANDTIKQFDRGVHWEIQDFVTKGRQWKSAYLPVWLYSYMEKKGGDNLLHYVAVNARTNETMGSVPIYMPKLLLITAIIEILGILTYTMFEFEYFWIILIAGLIYMGAIYSHYRNTGVRNYYEKETQRNVSNVDGRESFIKRVNHSSESRMYNANNTSVKGSSMGIKRENE